MPKYIEFEGKTIDQALENASRKLSIPVEDLKYDIVSHGSSGIFGLVGVKKAKIRVVDKKGAGNDGMNKDMKSQARDLVKDAFQLQDSPKTDPEKEVLVESAEKAEEEDTDTPIDDDLRAQLEQAASQGERALRQIADYITDNSTIAVDIRKERLIFRLEGGNSGLLIGKRGQTLEAIQYLVEKIVNKQNGQRIRVLVDVEGYLETRKNNLKSMASRMAEKAAKINKPVTIGQMNAYDRRIVHLHLKDNQGVRTQSVGEGYYRKLVIFPKKRRRNRNSS